MSGRTNGSRNRRQRRRAGLAVRVSRPARRQHGPVAIALEGEAGIGKSTFWRAAVEAARGRGLRVLSSRPAESERGLAYAGARRPLRRRPRRRPAGADPAAAAGARGRAPRRGRRRCLRWTRAPSGSRFAAPWSCSPRTGSCSRSTTSSGSTRRRRARSASRSAGCPRRDCCSSGRAGSASRGRRRVEDALDPDRIERVRVGPLSVGAIHQSLRARLARAVPRPTLLRLHEVSGGNPFYALELARALGDEGAVRGSDPAAAGSRAAGGARVRAARRLHRPDA